MNDREGFLKESTPGIKMAVMQTCLCLTASCLMMLECMTFAWPLFIRCDGIGLVGNCSIRQRMPPHGINSGYCNVSHQNTHGHKCKLSGDIEMQDLCLAFVCKV